jgi:hypothetical protein
MKIHILTMQGPEWNNIITAYCVKSEADKECERLNLIPAEKRNGTLERLSTYQVTTVLLIGDSL